MTQHLCSHCSGAVASDDGYCRHCGARLRETPQPGALPRAASEHRPDLLAWPHLLDRHRDAIAMVDSAHLVRRVNGPFEELACLDRAQIEGRRLDDFLALPNDNGHLLPATDGPLMFQFTGAGRPVSVEAGFYLTADDGYLVTLRDPRVEALTEERTDALWQLSGAVSSSLDPAVVLRGLAEQAARLLEIDLLTISLLDPDRGEVVTVAEYLAGTGEVALALERPAVRRLRALPLFQRVVSERQPLWMAETAQSSVVLFPMAVPGRVVGVLSVGVTGPRGMLSPREVSICRAIANQAGAALENARLYQAEVRAREEIGRLRDYNQAILDSLASGIFVINSRGVVQFWNRMMEQVTGLAREQTLRANLFERVAHLAPYREQVQTLGRSRKQFRIDRLTRQRSAVGPDPDFVGSQEVTESYLFQPLLQGGRVIGILGVVEDITHKMRLDAQLVRSERMAAVGELAAGVAHNFNNILAAIGGDAQLLKLTAEEHGLSEAVVDAAQMIYNETMRGGRIAHDLLSFARGQEPMLQVLDVKSVIDDTIRLVGNHPAAKSVQIETAISAHLPKVNVDPNQLHQVFFNIMLNALQAMPDGGGLKITGRVRAADEDPDLGVLEINFNDSGVGLAEEQIARVFDPFFSARQNGTLGTGLGLTVSLSMVKGMGGDIQMRSTPGAGTTVSILLPIVERRTDRRHGALQRGRILVVDDEPSVRRTLCSFLARRGYKVETAQDGNEAVQRVEESLAEVPYDVILMDLMLPKTDGVEATQLIKARDPKAQIVVLTGITTQETVRLALEHGARFSFSKPVNFAELLNIVECLRVARH